MSGLANQIPLSPPEYRHNVGAVDPKRYENPSGDLIYPIIAPHYYRKFFDFGYGRVARNLALQKIAPERYLGIDLHKGMIEWCQQSLTLKLPHYRFEHHNVYRVHMDKRLRKKITTYSLPAKDREFAGKCQRPCRTLL